MFEEYKSSLLDFYHVKRKSQRLTLNLDQPGREKLRKECVEVFLRKNTQKDKDLIRSIFDPRNQFDDQVRSIERFKLDKFRPLVSFMVEGRSTRDEGLVKLLAWLIDFPPYNEWRELSEEELKFIFEEAAKKHIEEENQEEEEKGNVTIDEEENKSDEEEIQVEDSNDDQSKEEEFKEESPSDNKDIEEDNHEPIYISRFSPRYITISCILLLFVGTISFAVWERSITSVKMPEAGEKFMYWNEDHYEPVKDDKQNVGAPIIPLNVQTLTQQRKITLPDTLTSYSIGKVWYKGRGKDHEFFTAAGVYPPDTVRTLKKLSTGILRDHISYYRYWHTRLAWFLCAAFFISLCGFAVSKLEKEVITKDDSGAQDTQAVLPLEEEPLVEQTEGSLAMQ